jgi:hypothetical protein
MPKCVVLISETAYSESHRPLLRRILSEKPDLFSAVGVDCENWEEAMDWLCVDLDVSGEMPGAFCNTTSHPDESVEEVMEFANQWCDLKGWPRNVNVLKI